MFSFSDYGGPFFLVASQSRIGYQQVGASLEYGETQLGQSSRSLHEYRAWPGIPPETRVR